MTLQFLQYSHTESLQLETHCLVVLGEDVNDLSHPDKLSQIPFVESLMKKSQRRGDKGVADLATPLSVDWPHGALASYVMLKASSTPFQRHSLLRLALAPLLTEHPKRFAIVLVGEAEKYAEDAYYVVTVNSSAMPCYKKKALPAQLETLVLYNLSPLPEISRERINARVAGHTLCRELTMTPPNILKPSTYRQRILMLAEKHGWQHREFDMVALKAMGAGAFVAVGQGSDPQDAAIVHLRYSAGEPKSHFALVGKGICFDTGGHNLKPAKYMQGMHEDMNGSAVALGILLATSLLKLPITLDCWLAIAQNHIGPKAYKQNDVVTALNGMSIEIVHTDAEGRMVLADTLTLASREQPQVILDYATLTGSMAVAVSERMSGVISNRNDLSDLAVAAGQAAGERVVAFPLESDFDSELDSTIADIKQCTLEAGGDHLLAAVFLSKFIEGDSAWLHTDLSSSNCKGGLGAVMSEVNGFGVGIGLEIITRLMSHRAK